MNKYLKEFLENFKDYVIFDYDQEKELVIQELLKEGNDSFKLFPYRVVEKVIDKINKVSRSWQYQPILIHYKCAKNPIVTKGYVPQIPLEILYRSTILLAVSGLGFTVEKMRRHLLYKGLACEVNDYFKFPSNAEDFINNI